MLVRGVWRKDGAAPAAGEHNRSVPLPARRSGSSTRPTRTSGGRGDRGRSAPLHSTPVLDATGASPTPEAPPLSRPPENPPINRRAAEIRRPMATASPLGPASPLPSALARGEGGETASPQHHSPPLPPRLYPHRRRRADVTAARTPLSNQWGEPTRRANERQRLSGGRSIGRAGGR